MREDRISSIDNEIEKTVTRVVIQQPSHAGYRVPFFKSLSNYENLQLKVLYGDRLGIKNVKPDGYVANEVKLYHYHFSRLHAYWHTAQWSACSPRESDVAILVWNVQYLSLIPSMLRARVHGVRCLLWGHGYSKSERRFKRWLRFLVSRLTDGVLFYDDQSRSIAIRNRWIRSEKAFLAPNAIDDRPIRRWHDYFSDHKTELFQFQADRSINPDFHLLFVSRMHRSNRLDRAIVATAKLKELYPQVRLTAIGPGEEEIERLTRQADDLDILGNIHFPGEIDDEKELAKWFLSASIFCYPQNIGLSLHHALHYGLPVVTASDSRLQNPEFQAIQPSGILHLYDTADEDGLFRVINGLLRDTERRQRSSHKCLDYARSKLTLARMTQGFVEAIFGEQQSRTGDSECILTSS